MFTRLIMFSISMDVSLWFGDVITEPVGVSGRLRDEVELPRNGSWFKPEFKGYYKISWAIHFNDNTLSCLLFM